MSRATDAAAKSDAVEASEIASAEVFPNFHHLRTNYQRGFQAGARWAQENIARLGD